MCGGVGEGPDLATEQEGLRASRGREEMVRRVYQYSIADEARTNFWSCASIKDKLHSVSAMDVLRTEDWITQALRTDGSQHCSGWAMLACRTTMASNYKRGSLSFRNSLANWEQLRFYCSQG